MASSPELWRPSRPAELLPLRGYPPERHSVIPCFRRWTPASCFPATTYLNLGWLLQFQAGVFGDPERSWLELGRLLGEAPLPVKTRPPLEKTSSAPLQSPPNQGHQWRLRLSRRHCSRSNRDVDDA